jgi:hypothetical protein
MIDSAQNISQKNIYSCCFRETEPGFEHYEVKASVKNEILIEIRITREVRYLR